MCATGAYLEQKQLCEKNDGTQHQDGRIHINKWGKILAIRPSWKIRDNVMFMLYKGNNGLFLFIEAMSRSNAYLL